MICSEYSVVWANMVNFNLSESEARKYKKALARQDFHAINTFVPDRYTVVLDAREIDDDARIKSAVEQVPDNHDFISECDFKLSINNMINYIKDLNCLTNMQKKCLICYIKEQSYDRVAERLNVSRSRVYSAIKTARNKMLNNKSIVDFFKKG